jgi:hypothetical protein
VHLRLRRTPRGEGAFCDGDARLFKSIRARFADSVFPGETLITELWRDGDKVTVRCKVKERDKVVLSNSGAAVERCTPSSPKPRRPQEGPRRRREAPKRRGAAPAAVTEESLQLVRHLRGHSRLPDEEPRPGAPGSAWCTSSSSSSSSSRRLTAAYLLDLKNGAWSR